MLAVALCSGPAWALGEQDLQAWLLVTGTGQVTGPVRWFGEVQPRAGLLQPELQTVILRAAAGYRLNDAVSLWLGYAWTPLLSPAFVNEHRPFQQLLVENPFTAFRLINRSRFEQRFIQGGPPVSLRVRHMLRAVVPLGESGWAVALFDELFVNLDPGAGLALNQNRVFLGVIKRLSPSLALEGGYLGQYVWRAPQLGDRLNHSLLVWLALTPG